MFSVNSLLYSSVVNLYKLLVLSAGINSFGSCLMFSSHFGVVVGTMILHS